MGFRVTTPVWDNSKAKGSDLLVLLAIADSADNTTGDAYPSIKTLADLCRLSERGVQYSIRNLISMQELSVFQRGNHKTSKYHVVLFDGLVFDDRGAKIAPLNHESGVQSATGQGCKDCTSESQVRGAIRDIQGCNPRHSGVQSATVAIERARDTLEPVLKQPVLKQPEEPMPVEAEREPEPERQVTYPIGEHTFQAFKAAYPKIAGKFLNEDLARLEFLRHPANWNQIVRAALNYAASSIVAGCLEQGGKGIKYPNNFIRDGTWKDWIDPEVLPSEDEVMGRRAKQELTAALKRNPEMMPPELSGDAKRLFRSLNTRWPFLAQMALEGRDITGPQISGPDFKVMAAEGGAASCL